MLFIIRHDVKLHNFVSVYDKLMPVVVYIDGGDDLDAETEKLVQPSASLAKNQSVVFVKVNYR